MKYNDIKLAEGRTVQVDGRLVLSDRSLLRPDCLRRIVELIMRCDGYTALSFRRVS